MKTFPTLLAMGATVAASFTGPPASANGTGAATGAAASAASKRPMVLPFEHDYDAAMSRAREARLPVFVEAWAPW